MTAPVLEFDHVSKLYARRARFGGRREPLRAVDDVSLSMAPGEIVALVGESGAGKSTLGRLAIGVEPPDLGRVRLEGADLAQLSSRAMRSVRHRTQLVFQDPFQSLHPGMRVGDIVAEPLLAAGVQRALRRPLSTAALEEVELAPADRYALRRPHELSGGQRQRVALARALVGRPRLIVADEPTSMLDVSLRAGILQLILAMRNRHDIAFLVITHDIATARYVADRLAVLHNGQLVEVGPTEQVIARPAHPYTRLLLDAVQKYSAA